MNCRRPGRCPFAGIDVGDEEIVADELGGFAHGFGEFLPAGPVVFSEAVLDGDDGEALLQVLVERDHLLGGFVAAVRFLEDVLFLFLVEKFAAGGIEGDKDVLAEDVAGFFDGEGDDFKGVLVGFEAGRESAFVAAAGAEPLVVRGLS